MDDINKYCIKKSRVDVKIFPTILASIKIVGNVGGDCSDISFIAGDHPAGVSIISSLMRRLLQRLHHLQPSVFTLKLSRSCPLN